MNQPEEILFAHLCNGIGKLVIYWASIEFEIDICVMTAFHGCNAKTWHKEIPRSFDKKQDFLKQSFKKVAKLAPFSKEGLFLMKKAGAMANHRNDLIHSILEEINSKDKTFIFRRIYAYNPNIHTFDLFKIPLPEIELIVQSAEDMVHEYRDFARRLMNAYVPKHNEQSN